MESTATGSLLEANIAIGAGDDGIDVDSPTTTLTRNLGLRNGDLGIEAVPGVTDGGQAAAAATPPSARTSTAASSLSLLHEDSSRSPSGCCARETSGRRHRSCHSRAKSDGTSRYRADIHGHFHPTLELVVTAGRARTHPANVPDQDEVPGSSPGRPFCHKHSSGVTVRPLR